MLAGAAFGALVLLPVAASSDEFSAGQREEIGRIVRDYLIANPEVLREAFEALERKQSLTGLVSARDALYRSSGDLVAGNPEGSVVLVEFFDYNCGYCKRSLPDVLKLIDSDKSLKIIMKEWPILGPGSQYAAKAALASRNQGKYWEFHLALLNERRVDESTVLAVAAKIGLDVERLKADMNSEEVAATLKANATTAEVLGIQGTPAFIVGEQLFPGAVGYDKLVEAIEKVRKDGGCRIC
jgi:protein-disulfide isomerase